MSETRTVTARQAKSAILKAFKTQRPLFLWGPPGIGKSEVIEGITKELGGLMIDLRLGQMDLTDVRGIPYYDRERNVMNWAPPVEFPSEEVASKYPIVVLFYDEFNTAAPSVQSSTYQWILNRRCGIHKLPDNVVQIAAGNREGDKGVTYRMPSPLSNRFIHLEMRTDFDSWEEWALNNNIHKDVIAYLTFAKQDLHDHDPRSASRSFPTPRTWTFVSELLQDDDTDDDTLINLISGTVGEGLALKFMAYRKTVGKLPNASDVLTGKVTRLKTRDISAQYSLIVSIAYELRAANEAKSPEFENMLNTGFRFLLDNFETELVVMASRLMFKTYTLPMKANLSAELWNEFTEKHGKFILSNASEMA